MHLWTQDRHVHLLTQAARDSAIGHLLKQAARDKRYLSLLTSFVILIGVVIFSFGVWELFKI